VCGTEGLSAIVSMLKLMGIYDIDLLARLEGGDILDWIDREGEEEGSEGHGSPLV
jgi:hypothetical protein